MRKRMQEVDICELDINCEFDMLPINPTACLTTALGNSLVQLQLRL